MQGRMNSLRGAFAECLAAFMQCLSSFSCIFEGSSHWAFPTTCLGVQGSMLQFGCPGLQEGVPPTPPPSTGRGIRTPPTDRGSRVDPQGVPSEPHKKTKFFHSASACWKFLHFEKVLPLKFAESHSWSVWGGFHPCHSQLTENRSLLSHFLPPPLTEGWGPVHPPPAFFWLLLEMFSTTQPSERRRFLPALEGGHPPTHPPPGGALPTAGPGLGSQLKVLSYELGVLFLPSLYARHADRARRFSCTRPPPAPPGPPITVDAAALHFRRYSAAGVWRLLCLPVPWECIFFAVRNWRSLRTSR